MTAEQKEEIEVLRSIFDCDDAIKFLEDCGRLDVQYLIGRPDEAQLSFLVEFRTFIEGYPESVGPQLNLDLFYNKHLLDDVKQNILQKLEAQCCSILGSPMLYTLIEFLKENLDQLMSHQKLSSSHAVDVHEENDDDSTTADLRDKRATAKESKENLSKAQKRKLWDRGEGGGEKGRGWNWVDVVKHLSQNGFCSD